MEEFDKECGEDCCNVPNTRTGYTARTQYILGQFTAIGVGISRYSQEDANSKAFQQAYHRAIAMQNLYSQSLL